MKNKVIYSLFIGGLYLAAYGLINTVIAEAQKFAALTQFSNSESAFLLMRNVGSLGYVNYLLGANVLFNYYSIWAPVLKGWFKKSVTVA